MLDVVIIGGGIVGCSVARELSKYNLEVALIERMAELSMGTTKANSGIVHAGYDTKPGTQKAKFNVRGNEMMDELTADLGVRFRRNGSLVLGFSAEDEQALLALKAQGEANGVKGMALLTKKEVQKREPHINPDVHSALYAPSAGLIFGPEITYALAENAHANGVDIKLSTEVTNIITEDNAYIVVTNNGTFKTKTIVNAAGLYADVMHNFVNDEKAEIEPRKGEYFLLDKAAKYIVEHTVFQLPSNHGKGTLVLPTIHDNILVGPSSEVVLNKEDMSTNAETLVNNINFAKLSIPSVPLQQTIATFAGLRAGLKDYYDFVVGESVPGFFNALGINSPGLTAAPAIGEYLCELIVEKLSVTKKRDFTLKREKLVLFDEKSLAEQKELIAKEPAYGRSVCRCEKVMEGDVIQSIHRPLGATTLDGLKFRSRAGSGRCQAGFCTAKLIDILARETGVSLYDITKRGAGSEVLKEKCKEEYS